MTEGAGNFVTLLTAPGVAAIATIRLIGPGASAFAGTHLSKPVAPGRCVHAELNDGERIIDDVLAVGVSDCTLEVCLHGGAWVVEAAIDLARRKGFAQIDWRSADSHHVHDTNDPIEQEMLAALPQVKTAQSIAILLAQPAAWRAMLASDDRAQFQRALDDRSLEHLLTPPTVAIVGAPNVGKSTLANQLFGRDRSITADLPGTTRDWVGAHANLDGLVVTLIDTPGVRETSDLIEQKAIEKSSHVVKKADDVILVLDVSQPFDEQRGITAAGPAVPAAQEGRSARRPSHESDVVVLNKVDQTPAWDISEFPTALRVCAKTGDGVDALRSRIRERFDCSDLTSLHARAWTDRQRSLLRERLSR
jgi:tRNA U34 5-carboxymethylaminomethyl modifying GTPase MnmE/TrmE